MGNENWTTPDHFFKRCEAAWGPFGLDAAAKQTDKKCTFYFGPDHAQGCLQDSLKLRGWREGRYILVGHESSPFNDNEMWWDTHGVWLNPPYRCLIQWVEKAIEEQKKGLRIVMLLPNDTDTRWFHMLMKWAEIYITKGRVQFIDPEGNRRKSPRQGHIVAVLHPPVNGVKRMNGICGTIEAGEG